MRGIELDDADDPIINIVARRIVEVGTSGVSDPQEIASIVVKRFKDNEAASARERT